MHFTDYWLQAQDQSGQQGYQQQGEEEDEQQQEQEHHNVDYRLLKERLTLYGKRRRAWLRGDFERVTSLSATFAKASDDDNDINVYSLLSEGTNTDDTERDDALRHLMALEEQADFQQLLQEQLERNNRWVQQQLEQEQERQAQWQQKHQSQLQSQLQDPQQPQQSSEVGPAVVQSPATSASGAEIELPQIMYTHSDDDITNLNDNNDKPSSSTDDNASSSLIRLMRLYIGCVTNIVVVRQLLLRYDAHCRTHAGLVLTEFELQKQDPNHVYTLFFQGRTRWTRGPGEEGEDGGFVCLQRMIRERLQLQQNQVQEEYSSNFHSSLELLLTKLQRSLDHSAAGIVQVTVHGHVTRRDQFLQRLRASYSLGSHHYVRLEPKFLMPQGKQLKSDMKRIARVVSSMAKVEKRRRQQQRAGQSSGSMDEDEEEQDSKGMEAGNRWGLLLNLIACFLYMMNNYIIEPSSAYYAESLGSSDALSGILLGMGPWFATFSAVIYSMWTNKSYRSPLLVAGALQIVGNAMYAMADSYHSLALCLVGRAIAGLGAPKIINRRYVADATPFSLRTVSSAAFATATALGAALGPAVAIGLDAIPEFSVLSVGNTSYVFNGMTGPGWFMAAGWFFYTIVIWLTFDEPIRSGLKELQQREKKIQQKKQQSESESSTHQQPLVDSFPEETGADLFEDYLVDGQNEDDLSAGGDSCSDSVVEGMSSDINPSSPFYCFKHLTRATVLCMALIFMKRIALECIVGSTSLVTKNRFGWGIRNVGVLHFVNGVIVIPVTVFAGWVSQFYQDRLLATYFLVVTVFGMLFLLDISDMTDLDSSETYNEGDVLAVGPHKYIAGSLIAFSGIEACESFVASLMSKVVPSALAVGTFNSGLLATLVGTMGRASGDLLITAMGLISLRNLLNLLIIPGLALMILSIFLLRRNYSIVAV